MHVGKDSLFYLQKGFDVVAVEANSVLVEQSLVSLQKYVETGQLKIHNIAVAEHEGEIEFFVNDQHDDWSTTSPSFAEQRALAGTTSTRIKVPCLPLGSLLKTHGIPYYLKVDIEDSDDLCLAALQKFNEKPQYVSVEFYEAGHISALETLGYHEFKIVNQAAHYRLRCPQPSREGHYVDYQFDGLCSGLFGKELPGRWMSASKARRAYRHLTKEQKFFGGRLREGLIQRAYQKIKGQPVGWYDLHARQPA